jgi:hypothetical protein
MDTIPRWRLVGDWFDTCKCDIPCPCEFAQPPTGNLCEGVLAYHIREGSFGDTQLDGLNLVALGVFEGNIWAGEASPILGLFIDERADSEQRQALQTIFGGQAGGWPAAFAKLVGEIRGVEFAPISFTIDEKLASWSVEIPDRVEARAEALTGPTADPAQRVQLLNPPGSEIGPGGIATWARATINHVDAFGFKWEWDGKSSKHIPFSWSGPDSA